MAPSAVAGRATPAEWSKRWETLCRAAMWILGAILISMLEAQESRKRGSLIEGERKEMERIKERQVKMSAGIKVRIK